MFSYEDPKFSEVCDLHHEVARLREELAAATPRTDALCKEKHTMLSWFEILRDHARQLERELAAARAETDIMVQACDRLVADVKSERRRNEELVALLREIQDNWLFGIQPEIRERIDRSLEGRDGQV